MTRTRADQRPSQRTLVIIPTFNERENLPLIVGRVHKARPDVHILIVDDGSPDGTGELADELVAGRYRPMHVMHRTRKGGLGAAYLAGFAWGLGREYSRAGRDGRRRQPPARTAASAAGRRRRGADLAIGSRYVPGGEVRNWPRRRMVLSRTANGYSRILLGVDITTSPRLPRLPARGAGEDRPGRGGLEGLLLPDRPDLAHHQQRVHRRRGADHVHRARVRPIQDERIQHPRGPVQGRRVGFPRAAWTGPAESALRD